MLSIFRLPLSLLHIFNQIQIQMTWQLLPFHLLCSICIPQAAPISVPPISPPYSAAISVLIIAKYQLTVNAKLLFTLHSVEQF